MLRHVILSRLLYIAALVALALLLVPNPVTVFMAACFACLTLPLYRRIQHRARVWRRNLERRKPTILRRRLLIPLSRGAHISLYTISVILMVMAPFAALVLLVSPQASAGLQRLRQLQSQNFQIPPEWSVYMDHGRAMLAEYPRLERIVTDFFMDLDAFLADITGVLVNRSLDVLGGTMTVLWTTFLFFTLSVLFVAYSRNIRRVAGRILFLPQAVIRRFIEALQRALGGIMLGIALVAVVQGVLCGFAFGVAGFKQPAFWGLLSTLTAPIPMVGTAIVWFPLSLSLWFTGKTVAAVGLVLWGLLVVANVDSILRPLFLRRAIRAPFFVLLTAILCGLASFGAVGLIVGPILLTVAVQAVEEGNRFYCPPQVS
ncbi:MAG: AI-2E family transporter [Desulfovibrio sp.]|jgi:predicted PurR-regulated permease PerM|nr:AI-2E family transporter [Desulfovibrio sp.]